MIIRNRQISTAITAFVLSIFIMGCASKNKTLYEEQPDYFEEGKKLLEKKKYEKAIEQFQMVLLNNPGGDLADDTQFYIAESYFLKEDFIIAAAEYQQLIQRYTYSPFVEEAYFKTSLSYSRSAPKYQLEQTNTKRALISLQEFVDSFPKSEFTPDAEMEITAIRDKLGRKLYASGVLYRKQHEYKAAIVYFENMLESYYDTKYALDSKIEKARCLVCLRKFDEYEEFRTKIENQYEPETLKEGLALLDRIYQKEQRQIEREIKRSRKRF